MRKFKIGALLVLGLSGLLAGACAKEQSGSVPYGAAAASSQHSTGGAGGTAVSSGGVPNTGGKSAQSGGNVAVFPSSGGAAVNSGGNAGTMSAAGGTAGSPNANCVAGYRNLFREAGHSDSEIDAKVAQLWAKLFEGSDNERVYYTVGTDEAYVSDVANGDVRSEGMSYGMMIAVQMDKQSAFDRLWRWAFNHMRHASGSRAGYFAWQCGTDGQIRDNNPASDGEAYFATSLLFAAGRWGNSGAFDYQAAAQDILKTMLHKEDLGVVDSVTNMFNKQQNMVVFTPYASAALFTDPSYHLPAFYEVWALGSPDAAFWQGAATTSRQFFGKTMQPTTGLAPDYANFDGTPTGSGHQEFRFDAWRVLSNLSVDAAWWGKNADAAPLVRKTLAFFRKEGLANYGNQYDLSGNKLSGDHSPGLVAMNALGALALPEGEANDFVEELWKLAPPSGQYRYYDGMLYSLATLHAAGRFQVFGPAAQLLAGCH